MMAEEKKVKLPNLVDDVHFKLDSEVDEGKFTALCLKCPQRVKAHVKSNSNLLGHLQKKHPEDYETYKTLRASEKSKSRVAQAINEKLSSQNEMNEAIVRFVTESAQAISIVENPAFRNILDVASSGRLKSMTSLERLSTQLWMTRVLSNNISTLQ